MHCLEVSQVLMKCILHLVLLLPAWGHPLLCLYALPHQVLLAAVCYQQCRCLLQCLLCLQSVQDYQGPLFRLIHIECVRQDNHHERYYEGAPDNQNDIDDPPKDGPRVKVTIANSGHGDYSKPNCILKGGYVIDISNK